MTIRPRIVRLAVAAAGTSCGHHKLTQRNLGLASEPAVAGGELRSNGRGPPVASLASGDGGNSCWSIERPTLG
jgi:hypothetical protein